MENDREYPMLIPNGMLLGRETATLEEYPDEDDESNWKRRQSILQNAKMRPGNNKKGSTLQLYKNDIM